MKSTKIVCTIGPASQDEKTMQRLVEAGMDIARMNMSHGSYDFHKLTIDNIRKVSKTTGKFSNPIFKPYERAMMPFP